MQAFSGIRKLLAACYISAIGIISVLKSLIQPLINTVVMSSLSHWRSSLLLLLVLFISSTAWAAPAVARVARDAKENKGDGDKIGATKDAVQGKKEEEVHFELFEGDIMLSVEQKAALTDSDQPTESSAVRNKRSIITAGESAGKAAIHHTWSDGVVPFERSAILDVAFRKMFDDAIKTIENKTCIRFVRRTTEENYLFFDNDDNCKSNVGCMGGLQRVTLSRSCASFGTALHELLHALGLWHEHSRTDRDEYIEVVDDNIEEQYKPHFKEVTQEVFKSVPDVGYDIQSVMHYSPYAFARDRSDSNGQTIRIRPNANLEELNCTNRLPMGQREQLSYKDQLRLNELYQCTDIVAQKPECIMPTPTPTTTEEPQTVSTVIPTPTSTTPSPTPAQDKRLRSRNIIALTLRQESEGSTVVDAHGMECHPTPGCTPIPCLGSACNGIANQFQIIKVDEDDGDDSIRNADTVVLRSYDVYSHFLDCSDPTVCVVSECREANVEDPNNASFISSCSKHQFQIYGINRNPNKILNIKHKLQFKSKHPHPDPKERAHDHYLSCNGKWCHLKRKGECPPAGAKTIFTPQRQSGDCVVDSFKANKFT